MYSPPLLFLIVLDLVLYQSNTERPPGIQSALNSKLEDLDYADEIVLLANGIAKMQARLTKLLEIAAKVGLQINVNKTKLL